ncbi:MAG: ATP-dependent protease HslVU (ClpYQ) peptidase subunit [Planctomycetota bacterium]|jgi:ATP-dependent protease HslVU (ClpYQ) peptidase subunit
MASEASHQIEVSPTALASAWRAVGHRIAAMAGSAAALLSLFQHTPVKVASLRGALVWAAIMLTTSLGAWLAEKTWHAQPQEPAPDPTEDA